MPDLDADMRPWLERLLEVTGPLDFYDAHTHIGQNDPDGFKQSPEELVAVLDDADCRAVVFPMHEPDGYPAANDAALQAAADNPDRLVAFCRVSPHDDAVTEARRALDAGARGIKLHPRAEQFGMDEPVVADIVALAHERSVPILIHAGRGIPALGANTVRLASEYPDATLILAHAAISDLAWMWKILPDHPNVLIDTAWWNPSDLMALFMLAPPANIVWASDSPYGRPILAGVLTLRCCLQAGVPVEAIRGICGGTLSRVLDAKRPEDLGPPPGDHAPGLSIHLERVIAHLGGAFNRLAGGADPTEPLGIARLSCAVGADDPHADQFARILDLLDKYEEGIGDSIPDRPFPPAVRYLLIAALIARTPDVPMPPVPAGAPAPTRDEAES